MRATPLRQECPRCGSTMHATYRPTSLSCATWRYVWYCKECRHTVTIPERDSE